MKRIKRITGIRCIQLVVAVVATGLTAAVELVVASFGLNFLFFFIEQSNSAENTHGVGVTNYIKNSTALIIVENQRGKRGYGRKEILNM
jgi:hypothetical protein